MPARYVYEHYSDVDMDSWNIASFQPWELASKREGALVIDVTAVTMLQELRDLIGKPIIVTSAYRSPAHNKAVGGATNSLHLEGRAFDINMANHDPAKFEAAARQVGFTGFGYYPRQGFMHIDTGRPRSWGTPFPKTATLTATEPTREPSSPLKDKKALAGIVGTVSAGGAAGGVLDSAAALHPLAQVGLVLAGVAIAYILLRPWLPEWAR